MTPDRYPEPVSLRANPSADHSISACGLVQTGSRPSRLVVLGVTISASVLSSPIVLLAVVFTEMPPITHALLWSGVLAASRGSYVHYRRVRLA